MQLIRTIALGAVALGALAACGQSDEAFRASYRTKAVDTCNQGARSTPAGPSIDKREATTQVLVVDGETMVIGGIFVDTQTNTVAGLPYLSRIPVLGWLFKNKTETVSKQELLIFLTPSIVKIT